MRQIPKSKVMCVVHSLWVSKLRYGLQLCTTTKLNSEDTTSTNMKDLQLTQNRLLRMINNSKISDKVSTKSMLEKFDLLSVNQLSAQIKLREVWKSLNCENYPIKLEPYNPTIETQAHFLRQRHNRFFNDSCRLQKSNTSFNVDAAKIWNSAPMSVKMATTRHEAKRLLILL